VTGLTIASFATAFHLARGLVMGAKFQIEHANFVAYLTAKGPSRAPHAEGADLSRFLESLTNPDSLISRTKGTSQDWCAEVASAASRELQALKATEGAILKPETVRARLAPLRKYFTEYDLYCLIIPSPYERDRESFNFFTEAALTSDSAGLILMPENAPNFVEFLNPFPAMSELANTPFAPPGVLFWSEAGRCVLPLKEAKRLYRSELVGALEDDPEGIDGILRREANKRKTKRILHLSDFHIGRQESNQRRGWLKTHLASILPSVDTAVITGDLINDTEEELRESFDEVRADLQRMAKSPILVFPGNHDVKAGGNSWRRFRRNADYMVDLRCH
jgi:hypothetical protein